MWHVLLLLLLLQINELFSLCIVPIERSKEVQIKHRISDKSKEVLFIFIL